MNFPENPSARSPKRELLGPRPTPLKVSKDSHKIKKPPLAQPRPPVIIYTVSPKIIHAQPDEFMSLVQRLTGQGSSSTAIPQSTQQACRSSSFDFQIDGGGVSPATRYASIEKTRTSEQVLDHDSECVFQLEGIEIGSDVQIGSSQFPGILSPNPHSLPPIPRSIFSPATDSSFFDFSPLLQSARNQNQSEDVNNYNVNAFQSPSASSFLLSPQLSIYSPSTLNLIRSLFEL